MINDLRNSFLNFFKERDHKIIPSSSLVPKEDPTLLFTTAGMVQFKPMFAGSVKLEYRRAASVQKCFRTSDLENVGKTKRHCTFFEMLGNFSFGDYFKKEAIRWAWEYSTDTLSFSKDDIWVSIYLDDDKAFEIWHKDIGVSENKIIRLGKEDNFWGPAGESGACGPCSELYLDRGAEYGCSSPDCKPGCDCERFLEYWNLVFNQYNQDVNGKLNPLPQTGIDTGMGLERLATLVQNVDSIYETDELYSLVKYICNESSLKYENDNITPINIIVEHSRALCFAISDGAYPSNEGRGYVLRRLLRRALRFTRMIGITEPFIHKIVDPIVEIMGECYPELRKTSSNVKDVLNTKDAFKTREWLVKNIKGLGYKEASHFLRNIGYGRDIAILDTHILKTLKKLGIIRKIPPYISKRNYCKIEDRMRRFARKKGIPLEELDLLLWSSETGFIFK